MEDQELIMISALNHYLYCSRRFALVHIEQTWFENLFTAEGRGIHDKVHGGGAESRKDIRTATGVRLVSHKLGLTGQADMVEFHKAEEEKDNGGQTIAVKLPGVKGLWEPFPVEYKRGKPKKHQADEVQLCAQAMCLEEMLKVNIPAGALFYGATRRRQEVAFTATLRELTETTTIKLHELMSTGITPPPQYNAAKCEKCSLLEICRPQTCDRQSVTRYIKRMVNEGDEKTS